MITRAQLEEMFKAARHYSWSIDAPCAWGYYFTDVDRGKLSRAEALEAEGFRFVEILEPDPGDDDQQTLFLHVERIEKHSVDSLHALNQRLTAIAEQFQLGAYEKVVQIGKIPDPQGRVPVGGAY